MKYTIQAACGCNTGKIRKKNEDNFYFDGKCLEKKNNGLKHPVFTEDTLKRGLSFAIFDGMGGEHYGELASYAAARRMQLTERSLADFFVPEKQYLKHLTAQLNEAVVEAQKEMCTQRMGATMVSLYFSGQYVYVCNAGDSRAYRLRDGEFLQLSVDHVDKGPVGESKKAPLTRHLGMDPEEIRMEPYIAKGEIKKGDMYLLCSDGLTDMLTNFEIAHIMLKSEDPAACVQALVDSALAHGGRDNVTVIVCKLQ